MIDKDTSAEYNIITTHELTAFWLKNNDYAVAGSLLRFWYRFIFDQRDVIQNGFGEPRADEIEPQSAHFSRADQG